MNVDEFMSHPIYGRSPAHQIDDVISKWNKNLSAGTSSDVAGMTTMLAALGIDAANGDGLLDQISPELLSSMKNLMGEKADTYEEARRLISEKIANGDLSFAGFVNKIKGQLGEDQFIAENSDYVLAISKSQEGIDAIRGRGSDFVEAVQVKMYKNANDVIHHMHIVQQKISDGLTVEGETIDKLSFAVPYDIAEEVRSKAAHHIDLSSIDIIPVSVTSNSLADAVVGAGENLTHPFIHIVEGSLSTIGFMVALDALTNTYLCFKGKKTFAEVSRDITVKTPIGAMAIGTSKLQPFFFLLLVGLKALLCFQ